MNQNAHEENEQEKTTNTRTERGTEGYPGAIPPRGISIEFRNVCGEVLVWKTHGRRHWHNEIAPGVSFLARNFCGLILIKPLEPRGSKPDLENNS